MTNLPSFHRIKNFSQLVEDNELFSQFSNEKLTDHYDSNYIQLHFNPTREEFRLLEKLFLDDQPSYLNFHWPENEGLFIDVLNYISQERYEMGKLELFHLSPADFQKSTSNPKVELTHVTEENIDAFLKLNYEEDLDHGSDFADHKQEVYRFKYASKNVSLVMATIDTQPAGSFILISSANFIEVDSVLTASSWRKKGIATEMLDYVKTKAAGEEKDVILLADAEGSPREMYLNMGFRLVASQIHLLKKIQKIL